MQADPNVTPFLDVLLVLLIIFMYLSLSQQKIIGAASRSDTVLKPNTIDRARVRPAMYAIAPMWSQALS
jgi:biopolymer transport protein ExbD